MMHPNTEVRFINEMIGFGVVATQFIPLGTITWVLDPLDQIFTSQQVARLSKPYQEVLDKYSFRDHRGRHILCWDHGRFVNHSFRSNCLTTAYNFEVAIRDIHPGEELTDDYGYLNLSTPFEAYPEPGVNRKVVYPDDLLRHHYEWDEELKSVFPKMANVEQPLSVYMKEKVFNEALMVSLGRKPMKSILSCYFKGS